MKTEEYTFANATGNYSRKVWWWRGGEEKQQQLCVFLDAEYYLYRMDTLAILATLLAEGKIPPVACLFVSNESNDARHCDYTCTPHFAQFIAHDLPNWVKETQSEILCSDILLCGLSLSGLASAYITLTNPDIFSAALCQSGSFWWNDEWLVGNLPPSRANQKFWVSVGDQETNAGIWHGGLYQGVSQKDATINFVRKLRDTDASVHFNVYSGGHAIAPWNSELPAALTWLLTLEHPPV